MFRLYHGLKGLLRVGIDGKYGFEFRHELGIDVHIHDDRGNVQVWVTYNMIEDYSSVYISNVVVKVLQKVLTCISRLQLDSKVYSVGDRKMVKVSLLEIHTLEELEVLMRVKGLL